MADPLSKFIDGTVKTFIILVVLVVVFGIYGIFHIFTPTTIVTKKPLIPEVKIVTEGKKSDTTYIYKEY